MLDMPAQVQEYREDEEVRYDRRYEKKSDKTRHSSSELWSRYLQAEASSQALFAEQRSNLLLVAGLHYTAQGQKFARALREIENVSKSQKIRLTKNHLQRITKTYRNNILRYCPGVTVYPRNDKELSDVKVAEMYNSVWQDMKEKSKLTMKIRQWAQDFIDVGECIAKVFFDERQGSFCGYDPLWDEAGNAVLDEEGKPVFATPVWTGAVVFERILGFNLLTDPDARSWDEVRWCIYRKMVPIKDLLSAFEDDQVKRGWITSSAEETWKIFDAATGSYRDNDGLIMLTEHYYRPCPGMEQGYFYITVHGGILDEGELPLGLFPIVYAGFDEAATSARSFSVIKQLRPYQAEINRAASKIAEHQITLGDDKVILSNGASMTPGGTAHGVKAIHVTGADPKVFAGRAGDQYVGYMTSQIGEMYQVANVEEDSREEISGQLDVYAILYKSASKKKPFVIYIQKFEEFLTDICKLALRYAKAYYTDDQLVPVVGKNEFVNLEEFRSSEELGFQIKVEPSTDDLDSKMGQALTTNMLIQYAGQQLTRGDIGKLMASMPWANNKQMFGDLTQNWDNWVNDRLAMDRGTYVAARRNEDHAYILERITGRQKESDYTLLPPMVQQSWDRKYQEHLQIQTQQLQEAQAAKEGFIPTGGYLTKVELSVEDPMKPGKMIRLYFPVESLMWLKGKIESQGQSQEMLGGMAQANQAAIGHMMMMQQQQMQQQQVPSGMAPQEPMPMAM